MIFIEKATTNDIILTLFESSRLSSPFFLFEFTNEYNLEATPIYWTSPDITVAENRYNHFRMIESSTGSTTGGTNTELNLVRGQYVYNVYESTAQTLSVSATTGRILETGKMVVKLNQNQNITDSIYD